MKLAGTTHWDGCECDECMADPWRRELKDVRERYRILDEKFATEQAAREADPWPHWLREAWTPRP